MISLSPPKLLTFRRSSRRYRIQAGPTEHMKAIGLAFTKFWQISKRYSTDCALQMVSFSPPKLLTFRRPCLRDTELFSLATWSNRRLTLTTKWMDAHSIKYFILEKYWVFQITLLTRWGGQVVHEATLILKLVELKQLWHYRLWSFQGRDTKLERFLHKNQL